MVYVPLAPEYVIKLKWLRNDNVSEPPGVSFVVDAYIHPTPVVNLHARFCNVLAPVTDNEPLISPPVAVSSKGPNEFVPRSTSFRPTRRWMRERSHRMVDDVATR